jgi:ABC-type branched-subunit amino acid transport system substrate-binding protein
MTSALKRRHVPKRRGRQWAAIAAVAMAAGSMAACSSKSAPSGASASASKGDYVIGIDADMSGRLASANGPEDAGFTAAAEAINAAGGVGGHKLKLVALDNKSDAAQTVQNFNQLIGQEKALVIIGGTYGPSPYAAVDAAKIPLLTHTGYAEDFLPSHPSVFPVSGQIIGWAAETAHWLTTVDGKHPKTVEVLYSPANANYKSFIESYWKKAGATTVLFDPAGADTSDCTALVLKWRSAGVDYLDVQSSTEWQSCFKAEERLGWKPVLGQGGAYTSQVGQAQLLGKPMDGVVGGAPNVFSDGSPVHTGSATVADYVAAMKKYAPNFATPNYLNASGPAQAFAIFDLIKTVIEKAQANPGTVTRSTFVSTLQGMKNWDSGLLSPVPSFAPDCKTGASGTVWGHWQYQATQTPPLALHLTSTQFETDDWLGEGPCVLSKLAQSAVGHS